MSENAAQSAQNISPQVIYDEWEKVLQETAKLKGKTKLGSFEVVEDELKYDAGLSKTT